MHRIVAAQPFDDRIAGSRNADRTAGAKDGKELVVAGSLGSHGQAHTLLRNAMKPEADLGIHGKSANYKICEWSLRRLALRLRDRIGEKPDAGLDLLLLDR